MSEKKIRNFNLFNKIMVNGLLWLVAAMLAFMALDNIVCAYQNDGMGVEFVIELIMQLVLLGSAALLVKASFDLRQKRIKGAGEIMTAGFLATVIFIIELLAVNSLGGYREITFFYPLFTVCWPIGVYRYYMKFRDEMTGY